MAADLAVARSSRWISERAAFREGAHALPADSWVRSESPEDGPCLHVGFRREAFRVEFARLGFDHVLPIHFVRPRVRAPETPFSLTMASLYVEGAMYM